MNLRNEFKQLWRESFDDTQEFVEMFFSRVYNDDDVITLSHDGSIISALLLQRYNISFHGTDSPMAYICGAATRRAQRGRGYMSSLIRAALYESYKRGDTFCALIPAHSWLYPFYSRFGFTKTVLVNADHYTALHPFATEGDYHSVANVYDERVYDAFQRFERMSACRVLHSRRDFLNILDDNNLSGGSVAVMADGGLDGHIVSMAFAVPDGDTIRITDVMGESDDACTAALRQVRSAFADMPFDVAALPTDTQSSRRRSLSPRGMMRIVNVEACLRCIAASHPEWSSTIRVSDQIIRENNHTYIVKGGDVDTNDQQKKMPDMDVDVSTLTDIAFSSPKIGEIMRIPSVRPEMTLMLD